MIAYFTCECWEGVDPSKPPHTQANAGGMSSKTFRVVEALSERYHVRKVYDFDDIEPGDLVIAEPLGFWIGREGQDLTPLAARWQSLKNKKVLYCSEATLVRFKPPVRERLLEGADMVTANCQFQADIFGYHGIIPDQILTDPVPEEVFYPLADKLPPKRFTACGHIDWMKNTAQIADAAAAVKKDTEDAEFCYIGSSKLWHGDPTRQALALERRIREAADVYRPSLSQQAVAKELRESRCYVIDTFHDTFSTAMAEAMMCGVPVVGGGLGLMRERPTWSLEGDGGAESLADAIEDVLNLKPDEWAAASQRTYDWAMANVSYEAFLDQFSDLVGRLWGR